VELVTEAARSGGSLLIGIVGLNPAQGMDVCLRPSVLCCPVSTLESENIYVHTCKNVEPQEK
jgi:hypothetical protein